MKTRRIVCYGDSNTYGFDPRDFGRYDAALRWPDVMQRLISEAQPDIETEVINEGLNGRAINLRGIKDWTPPVSAADMAGMAVAAGDPAPDELFAMQIAR